VLRCHRALRRRKDTRQYTFSSGLRYKQWAEKVIAPTRKKPWYGKLSPKEQKADRRWMSDVMWIATGPGTWLVENSALPSIPPMTLEICVIVLAALLSGTTRHFFTNKIHFLDCQKPTSWEHSFLFSVDWYRGRHTCWSCSWLQVCIEPSLPNHSQWHSPVSRVDGKHSILNR